MTWDVTSRAHLTSARALVLDIVAESEPITQAGILTQWMQRSPASSGRHRDQLPRVLLQILWRVVNLGWVRREGDAYLLTPTGHLMRDVRGSSQRG